MTKTKTDSARPTPSTAEKDDAYDFDLWMEEAELDNIIYFDTIPAFNEAFAKLIKESIKTGDEFMEVLRVEGHIFSYDNFVTIMGNTPAYIFNVFGNTIITKHHRNFMNAWIFASFLRKNPIINESEDIFDLSFFNQAEWAKYFGAQRRTMQSQFITDFGLRNAHDENVRKENISKTKDENVKTTKSTGDELPASTSKESKDTKSPIKEKTTKDKDFDEEPPPPSSADEDSEEEKDG
jgi:hypothetical protein